MDTEPGLLHNRAIAASLLVSCTVASVWAWTRINTAYTSSPSQYSSVSGHSAFEAGAFAYSAFIGASIAYRSRLWLDRVVFGAIGVGLGLGILRQASTPMLGGILAIAKAATWSIAACTSLLAMTLPRRR
jgi:hypothetical protein